MSEGTILIRLAEPADAAKLIAYVQRLTEEPGINILLSPGEFQYTVEEEAKIVADYNAADNSLFLVASVGEEIIGILTIKGGTRQAIRHAAELGITVAREWRNQGVGYRLMDYALEWARKAGILRRIELIVFVRNQPAIHLYEKFGFAIEGRRRKAAFRDGEFLDDYVMAVLL